MKFLRFKEKDIQGYENTEKNGNTKRLPKTKCLNPFFKYKNVKIYNIKKDIVSEATEPLQKSKEMRFEAFILTISLMSAPIFITTKILAAVFNIGVPFFSTEIQYSEVAMITQGAFTLYLWRELKNTNKNIIQEFKQQQNVVGKVLYEIYKETKNTISKLNPIFGSVITAIGFMETWRSGWKQGMLVAGTLLTSFIVIGGIGDLLYRKILLDSLHKIAKNNILENEQTQN